MRARLLSSTAIASGVVPPYRDPLNRNDVPIWFRPKPR